MQTIALRLTTAAHGGVCRLALREVRGEDELAVDGIDTRAALRLIDRLVDRDDTDAPSANALCASDRDRLLAAVYRHAWGDTILATPTCIRCGQPFDLSFSLAALQRHLDAQRVDDATQVVPVGHDELAAADLPWDDGIALLKTAAANAAPERLDSVAPLLDVDVEARCPECDNVQLAAFDIQSFLLASLLNERAALLQDVHLLASSYGWPLHEILMLSRTERRALVAIIDEERR